MATGTTFPKLHQIPAWLLDVYQRAAHLPTHREQVEFPVGTGAAQVPRVKITTQDELNRLDNLPGFWIRGHLLEARITLWH